MRLFARVYYIDLERDYPGVWKDDRMLALWLRLLARADRFWPSPVEIPRALNPGALKGLVDAGLVELQPEHCYRIRGYDSDRNARRTAARNAAASRWAHATADANADADADANGHADADARAMLTTSTSTSTKNLGSGSGSGSIPEAARARKEPREYDEDDYDRAVRDAMRKQGLPVDAKYDPDAFHNRVQRPPR